MTDGFSDAYAGMREAEEEQIKWEEKRKEHPVLYKQYLELSERVKGWESDIRHLNRVIQADEDMMEDFRHQIMTGKQKN